MTQRTPSGTSPARGLSASDLARIDRLLARIVAGPGEEIGEKTFSAFAGSELARIGPPERFIDDNAGLVAEEPGPDEAPDLDEYRP